MAACTNSEIILAAINEYIAACSYGAPWIPDLIIGIVVMVATAPTAACTKAITDTILTALHAGDHFKSNPIPVAITSENVMIAKKLTT